MFLPMVCMSVTYAYSWELLTGMITELWYVKFERSWLLFCLCCVLIYKLWRKTGVRETSWFPWAGHGKHTGMGTISSKLIKFISADVFFCHAVCYLDSVFINSLRFFNLSLPISFRNLYECIITEYVRVKSLNNSIVALSCNSFPTVLPLCLWLQGLRGTNSAPWSE